MSEANNSQEQGKAPGLERLTEAWHKAGWNWRLMPLFVMMDEPSFRTRMKVLVTDLLTKNQSAEEQEKTVNALMHLADTADKKGHLRKPAWMAPEHLYTDPEKREADLRVDPHALVNEFLKTIGLNPRGPGLAPPPGLGPGRGPGRGPFAPGNTMVVPSTLEAIAS